MKNNETDKGRLAGVAITLMSAWKARVRRFINSERSANNEARPIRDTQRTGPKACSTVKRIAKETNC